MKKYVQIVISILFLIVLNILFQFIGTGNSFRLGLVAALTPCTIVLVPIFLYRFGIWGDKKIILKELVLTSLGYIITFSLIGLLFGEISKSFLFDTAKILMIIFIIIFGALQVLHKINFDILSKAGNPFIFGLLLPLAITFSTCVLPFFTTELVHISDTSGTLLAVISIVSFSIGILTPAILVGLFGSEIFNFLKKSQKITKYIDYVGAFIMFATAIYLMFKIVALEPITIFITFFTVLALQGYIIYKFFISDLARTSSKFLFLILSSISILLLLFRILYLSTIYYTNPAYEYSCNYDLIICMQCSEAGLLFGIIALILIFTKLVIESKYLDKFKFTF